MKLRRVVATFTLGLRVVNVRLLASVVKAGASLPSSDIGHGLAASLRDAVEEAGYDGSALRSLEQQFEKEMLLPRDRETINAMQRTRDIVAEYQSPGTAACEPMLQALCPAKWEVVGKACVAPPGYAGPCRRVQSFQGASDLAKESFSARCRAPWPCVDSGSSVSTCDRDYDQCPANWRRISRSSCEASPGLYAGDCLYVMSFLNMTAQQKRNFAEMCSAPFPCRA
eukprot:TRINITY_DN19337_c2_g3_i1.p1 TRINITY_DN19337_c2_g3~~TRINITY_DN19337_c2_g3_i1.p1  ORF type:complete len:226 (-),score=35.82 TRINITY_DN19337_c2_g3_i1:29-706(-)